MSRPYYTDEEITLCVYAALHDGDEIGGNQAIGTLTGRPLSSISAKVRNIAAKLDEEGIHRTNTLSALTGTTTGKPARSTNWETVEPLTKITREELLLRCHTIFANHKKANLL